MILEWEQYCWNGFIWKCIRLQTAWHVIHKYKHLPKKKKKNPAIIWWLLPWWFIGTREVLHGGRCQSGLTHFSGVHYTHETEPILLHSDFDIYREMKWGFGNEDFKWNPYQRVCDGAVLVSPLLEDPPCQVHAFSVTADGNLYDQVCWVIKNKILNKFNWLLSSFLNVSV